LHVYLLGFWFYALIGRASHSMDKN